MNLSTSLNANVNKTISRLSIPKSKLSCCSKNCISKPNNNHCLSLLQNKNMKIITNNNQLKTKKISNENDSFLLNSTLFKSSLIAKRNLYNEKIKNEALNKVHKEVKDLKRENRERSRCFNSNQISNKKEEEVFEVIDYNTVGLMQICNNDEKSIFLSSGKKSRNSSLYSSRNFQSISYENKADKKIIINNNNNFYINQVLQNKNLLNNLAPNFNTLNYEIVGENQFDILNKNKIYIDQNDNRKFCFKKLQSKKDWDIYGKDFKKQLYIDQQIHRRNKLSKMFQNDYNKITEKMRSKMVDWMIEVLFNYKTNENTFFLAVEILDGYLTNNNSKVILPSDLHLIGCTCMFLSSKVIDIRPIKLKTVHEKIAHEKIQTHEIKAQEQEILKVLKFNVNLPTILEYSSIFCYELFNILNNWSYENEMLSCENCNLCTKINKLNDLEEENFERIIKPESYKYDIGFIHLFKSVLIYVEKLICHDYKLMSEFPSTLSSGSIIVSFKICEQITNCSYLSNNIIKILEEISEMSNYELILISQTILKLSQDFEENFKGLENLKKIHISDITSFVVTTAK